MVTMGLSLVHYVIVTLLISNAILTLGQWIKYKKKKDDGIYLQITVGEELNTVF